MPASVRGVGCGRSGVGTKSGRAVQVYRRGADRWFMNSLRLPPVGLVAFCAILWGVWWLPIRLLNEQGIDGGWAGILLNAVAALVLLPVIFLRKESAGTSVAQIAGAMLIGFGVGLYAIAVSFTDVLRAVLLFYLAPMWSTMIECAFLGRRWSTLSIVAVLLALSGMVLILGDNLILGHVRAGDILALVSGIFWSVGATFVFSASRSKPLVSAAICMLGATLVGIGAAVFAGGSTGALPSRDALTAVAPILVLTSCLYIVPMIVITLWGAAVLAPALLSFLFSLEILSGVGSSALLLDEPFGWREISGALLVGLGAVTEFLMPGRIDKKQENSDS